MVAPPETEAFGNSTLNSRFPARSGLRESDRPGTENLYLDGKELPKDSPVFGKDWYSGRPLRRVGSEEFV